MSLDHEPTARPVVAPKGRWSEYTQLSRQIKQAGLLDRRRGWYGARIGLNLALLAGGWVAFAMLGESWWQLLTAAYLAVVFTQLAFVGHDAGHRQLFRSRYRSLDHSNPASSHPATSPPPRTADPIGPARSRPDTPTSPVEAHRATSRHPYRRHPWTAMTAAPTPA